VGADVIYAKSTLELQSRGADFEKMDRVPSRVGK
jgi:hypothetical protein